VRFTMLAGCVTVLAGSLLMAFAVRTVWEMYLVFGAIIGLGALSGGILGAQAGIGRWFVKHKARAITLVHTGSAFGGFVAAPALNHTIAAFGGNWRAGWMLIAGLSFVASLLAFFFIKENPAELGQMPDGASKAEDRAVSPHERAGRREVHKTTEVWTLGEVFHTPAIWMFLVAILGFSAGYPLFLAQGVAHLRDLGYTAAAAAFSVSVMLLASLGGTLLFAGIADLVEPRFVWAAASVLFGVGMILARHASGAAGLYLYAVCLGAGFGASFSAMMALPANYYGPRAYAPIVSVVIAVGTTAGAAGPVAAGYIYDRFHNYDPAFYAVSAMSFLAALLLLFAAPPVRKAARSFVPAIE
jgi:MFS family permease